MKKETLINNYEELKNISITALEQNHNKKFKIKGYDAYLLYCVPYYKNTLIVVCNEKVIYIDEEIQYSDNAVPKMIERAKQKLFTDEEIKNDTIKSYDDYLNKENYLNNILPHKFGYISMFYIGERPQEEQEQIAKMYPCSVIGFCYFNEKWQADYLTNLYKILQEKYNEFLGDKNNREQAILYELLNHEAFYTCDTESTFWAIKDKFTREEINNVFNKNLKKYGQY